MRSRPVIEAFIGSVLFGESAWKARPAIMEPSHRNRKPEGELSNAYYGSDSTGTGKDGTYLPRVSPGKKDDHSAFATDFGKVDSPLAGRTLLFLH